MTPPRFYGSSETRTVNSFGVNLLHDDRGSGRGGRSAAILRTPNEPTEEPFIVLDPPPPLSQKAENLAVRMADPRGRPPGPEPGFRFF
jgi:hypothetical protein